MICEIETFGYKSCIIFLKYLVFIFSLFIPSRSSLKRKEATDVRKTFGVPLHVLCAREGMVDFDLKITDNNITYLI